MLGSSHASTTASASSVAPSPPSEKWVHTATRAPTDSAISRIAWCSAVEVAREGVDGDDRRDTVDLDVLDLLDEVRGTGAHVVGVLGEQVGRQRLAGDDLELAAVRLQRSHRGDEHSGVGHEARVAALDVEEPLGAHVGAEAGLGDAGSRRCGCR